MSGDERAAAPASLVANSTWLLGSRIATAVIGGALSIYAIRMLSVEEWGRYSAVISLVAIFAVVTEAGLTQLLLRELAAKPEQERATVATATSAILLTGTAAVLLMLLTALALGYFEDADLVLAAALVIVFQGVSTPLFAIFNAHRVLSYPALLGAGNALLSAAVAGTLLATGAGPLALFAGTLAGQLLAILGGYRLLRTRLAIRPRPRRPDGVTRGFMLAALPIAATGGLTIVYQRIDILMLAEIDGDAAVAIYAVPYTIVQYTWMLPQVVSAAYFPVLSNALRHDLADARASFFLVVRLFFVASLPITLFLVVAGGPLMGAIFGDAYRDASTVLAIMAWISVLGYQNYVLWYGILAVGKEKLVVGIQAGGLAINVALNAALIPAYGPEGAAAALLASDFIVVAGQAAIVHRHVFPIPWAAVFTRPAAAAVVAGAVVAALLGVSSLLAGALGAAAYVLVLLATRYVTWEEWAPVRAPLAALVRREPA